MTDIKYKVAVWNGIIASILLIVSLVWFIISLAKYNP